MQRPDLGSLSARWWWSMPPDRLRVAMAVLDLCAALGGRLRVDLHSLSLAVGVSRRTVDRTLDELEERGVIRRLSTAGRGGCTEVAAQFSAHLPAQFPAHLSNPPNDQDNRENGKPLEKAAQFPAHLIRDSAAPFHQPVLDLPESPQKDPESGSDLPTRTQLPEKKERSATSTMTAPMPTEQSNPQPKRPRVDPAKIEAIAWRTADALRERILKYQPDHKLAVVAWGKETGTRLAWAHTFDMMHRLDGRAWGEIAGVIRWLYPDDPAQLVHSGPASMFVVQSADSLREKFDRIQTARRKTLAAAPARAPNGQIDTQATKTFKPWGAD